MPKKKFTEQAKANLANVAKSHKELQLELRKVKKDIEHMIAFRHDGPTYSYKNCPEKIKRS